MKLGEHKGYMIECNSPTYVGDGDYRVWISTKRDGRIIGYGLDKQFGIALVKAVDSVQRDGRRWAACEVTAAAELSRMASKTMAAWRRTALVTPGDRME